MTCSRGERNGRGGGGRYRNLGVWVRGAAVAARARGRLYKETGTLRQKGECMYRCRFSSHLLHDHSVGELELQRPLGSLQRTKKGEEDKGERCGEEKKVRCVLSYTSCAARLHPLDSKRSDDTCIARRPLPINY